MCWLIRRRGRDLAQRRKVVEHPDAAAVRPYHQVVAVDHHIAVGRVGEIELQRLPIVAVVERDVHPALGAHEQQPRLLRVGADHAGEAATGLIGGQAGDDCRPRLAVVVGAEEVRLVVARAVQVGRDVSGRGIEGGCVNRQDVGAAGDRQARNRHVMPGLALVHRQLDEAVVGADPDDAALDGGQCQRLNRAANGSPGRAAPAHAVGRRGDVRRVAQVGRKLGPVHAAVGRRHQELERRDQLVLVPRRERQGLRDGGASIETGIDVGTDVDPLLARVRDLQDPRAAGVDDVGMQRIGNRRAPLPAGHRIPVERRDGAQVAAAARADGARVLLGAVHPVGV